MFFVWTHGPKSTNPPDPADSLDFLHYGALANMFYKYPPHTHTHIFSDSADFLWDTLCVSSWRDPITEITCLPLGGVSALLITCHVILGKPFNLLGSHVD